MIRCCYQGISRREKCVKSMKAVLGIRCSRKSISAPAKRVRRHRLPSCRYDRAYAPKRRLGYRRQSSARARHYRASQPRSPIIFSSSAYFQCLYISDIISRSRVISLHVMIVAPNARGYLLYSQMPIMKMIYFGITHAALASY